MIPLTRRQFLASTAAAAALAVPGAALAQGPTHQKKIPSSGELLSAIGLGTWITFDVAPGGASQPVCNAVMRGLLRSGGQMIDSSPMYGQAQAVVGEGLDAIGTPLSKNCFSATKVWVPGASLGERQMKQALELWGQKRFNLIHVHNMVDWEAHLVWMQRWKEKGWLDYTGISTSHGRRHAAMEDVIRTQPFDFVQFTYNIGDRDAERSLLPLAQQHGKAVVVNRPFRTGGLFRAVGDAPLPDWAAEIEAHNWAQFFLKFVISHPAVTCAIPATRNPEHLAENMAALSGPLPDAAMRAEMAAYFDSVV